MTRSSWKPYSLPRDSAESGRLNLQHEVHKVNTGYLLHPRIVKELPRDAHVAEIGTGTGIWLRDLAAESPASWSYTGLDISDEQFPKSKDGRVTFSTLNVLETIPDEFKAKFDAVHLRLLICGFTGRDWDVAAGNILQMLKPGGWIQWHEGDFAQMQVYSNAPGASTINCSRMLELMVHSHNKYGKLRDEVPRLRQIVSAAGFEDSMENLISSDRVADTREAANKVELGALYAICKLTVGKDSEHGWTVEQVDELNVRCQEEIKDVKAYYRWNMHIITARKPSE